MIFLSLPLRMTLIPERRRQIIKIYVSKLEEMSLFKHEVENYENSRVKLKMFKLISINRSTSWSRKNNWNEREFTWKLFTSFVL